MSKSPDLFSKITNQILEKLEQGVRPWHQPWNALHKAGPITRPLRNNGMAYQGINVVVLWLTAFERGFTCPIWLTFKQAKELGGHIQRGETGTTVVFASSFVKSDTDTETGDEHCERIPFLKAYTVFNAEQIAGLPESYYAHKQSPLNPDTRHERIEAFFQQTRADIRTGGNRAFYSIHQDYVQIPRFDNFESPESYYATLAHELCHWTRHPERLNRSFEQKRFGDQGYAMEELVAELGAAFLSIDLGLTPEVREDHASYLQSWLKVLQSDKKAIFTAASHAEKAVQFLQQLQPNN